MISTKTIYWHALRGICVRRPVFEFSVMDWTVKRTENIPNLNYTEITAGHQETHTWSMEAASVGAAQVCDEHDDHGRTA